MAWRGESRALLNARRRQFPSTPGYSDGFDHSGEQQGALGQFRCVDELVFRDVGGHVNHGMTAIVSIESDVEFHRTLMVLRAVRNCGGLGDQSIPGYLPHRSCRALHHFSFQLCFNLMLLLNKTVCALSHLLGPPKHDLKKFIEANR